MTVSYRYNENEPNLKPGLIPDCQRVKNRVAGVGGELFVETVGQKVGEKISEGEKRAMK